jgi:hypothetical protein
MNHADRLRSRSDTQPRFLRRMIRGMDAVDVRVVARRSVRSQRSPVRDAATQRAAPDARAVTRKAAESLGDKR